MSQHVLSSVPMFHYLINYYCVFIFIIRLIVQGGSIRHVRWIMFDMQDDDVLRFPVHNSQTIYSHTTATQQSGSIMYRVDLTLLIFLGASVL